MIATSSLRKVHRWLGLVIGLQILMWTLSGIFFAWTDLDEVRGDHLRRALDPVGIGAGWVSPSAVDFTPVAGFAPDRIAGMDLVRVGPSVFYRFVDAEGELALVDVRDGSIRPALDRDEAVALARQSFLPEVPVRSVRRIGPEDVGPHHEYRGGALPAWVVEFDHGSDTRVYVAARSAEVTRHRNGIWRAFDFLWMLHTMDYRGRDDFNHPLLRGMAVFALVLTITGYLLFGRTVRRRRRRTVRS